MKVLLITSSAPFGKGESFVITEANAIASLGHNVILLPTLIRKGNANNFKLLDNIKLLAKPVISLRFFFDFILFFINNPRSTINLFRLVTDKDFKNSFKNYLVIPKSIWLAKYIRENPVDHIHAHWLTASSTLAMLVSLLTNIAWSVTAHRGDIVADNILEKKFETASFVRFISKSGKELANSRAELKDNKAKVLHLGIDIEGLNCIEPVVKIKSADKFNIICPANLIDVKGHDFLIDSIFGMQFRNKVKFFIVGDGYLRKRLEDKVNQLGLKKIIEFCGHIPHSELLSWYKSGEIHAVVLPSLDLGNSVHEGIPVSLMEAMAFNIPVLSTRTGGIPELLEHNSQQYGFLVDAGNVNQLSKKLDELIQYPDRNKKLAESGYQKIMKDFNQLSSVLELIKLITNAS